MSERYDYPLTDARHAYTQLMLAEYKFRQELGKVHLKCPACKKMATINSDRGVYWISCTMCGLRTSNSTDFGAVANQWDVLCERPLDQAYEPTLGLPESHESTESPAEPFEL